LGVVPKRKDSFGNEAFSTKILEFMMLNVPVVVSDTTIDRYYFDDSLVRFFRSGDVEDLASGLHSLATSEEDRNALAARARAFVDINCWDVKKTLYYKIVDSLVRPHCEQPANTAPVITPR